MSGKVLPPRPSLENYKKQAKDLVKAWNAGDPEAIRRVLSHSTRLRNLPPSEHWPALALSDAQFIIAREHGTESWPKFAKAIQSSRPTVSRAAPWELAQKALIDGDEFTLDRLLREHAEMFREQQPPAYERGGPRPDYSGGDARSIIAKNHHFESWAEFADFREACRRKDSPVARFEAAIDHIVAGDLVRLDNLLRENPQLINARSTRRHHATLLHYVGANGVEDFRQKTPRNIVSIAEALLNAGSDVGAEADIYGRSKTLGLAVTSIHPVRAGVLDDLIATLLKHGAVVEGAEGSSIVNTCLANGRPGGARVMAEHGAFLDLEGASGLGEIEKVKGFFNSDGSLRSNATKAQMIDGFTWACEFGQTTVVDFLLRSGVEVGVRVKHHGQTGLHWAASNGHVDTVNLLLERRAPVNAKDQAWGGTPLSWTLHSWADMPATDQSDDYYEVVDRLIAAGATVSPEWLAEEAIRANPRMLRALNGGIRG